MKIKNLFQKIKDSTLDVVFPNGFKCIICGKEIADGIICNHCKENNNFNVGNRCKVCDTPIKEGNIICDHCKSNKRAFKSVSCPLLYSEDVRKSLLKFKSDGAKYLAAPFAKLIYQRLCEDKIEFDVIIPVPSHKKTMRKRGYNPAKELAEELSILASKPVLDILVKTTITKNQKFLDFKERQTNLENTLTITDPKLVKNMKVLLVDDIITTGATVNSCAVLMHKAASIHVCAVARRAI